MSIERLRLRIVGLPYHDARQVWNACEAGLISNLVSLTADDHIPLELRPEPTNQNDPNAIQIYLDPNFTGGRDYRLGYVPRQDAPTVHAMMAGAGHLGAAIEPGAIDEPLDRTMWRALLETDCPPIGADGFKLKGTVPTPVWRNQALNPSVRVGSPDPARQKARPRRPKRLVHAWF